MNTTAKIRAVARSELQIPVVLFGIGIATLVLYLLTFAIHVRGENDFYREALPSYRLLTHGHFLAFVRTSPAYVGSLLLRAPFALLASAFGAGRRAMYFVTALPCMLAPGVLAGYIAAHRSGGGETAEGGGRRGFRPIDLVMLIPSVAIALNDGHPEDILGAAFCVLAVLLAHRGAGKTAGFILGIAVINKSWAVVVVPLVFAVMPADRRLSSFVTLVLTAGGVMVPLTLMRASSAGSAGNALGGQASGIFLIPQLLWWFGKSSWVAREAHVLLVVVDWLVTGAWWWLRARGRPQPRVEEVLIVLALVFFLRAALDPWDNFYYFAPFMMTLAAYEDPPGFPKLTWLYAIAIVIIVPPPGLLRGLGDNGHAAVFSAFALLTIAWFGWRAFRPDRTPSAASIRPLPDHAALHP